MRENKKTTTIQVAVSPELKAEFAVAASRDYTSASSLARRLIIEYLRSLEGDKK
ncbi:hypothetical protein [Pseudonocardia abyssalis]|uniref:Ribbon-helix-helix CopG family protein n=1 Tax=Pseudonocardia abyssalis TaxID=2792008 RepID=A0ABS6UX52_9PSEU|nr:hypothetical protein [Pseudonocardia abyssalis]MBW0115404.1 hypothetical protein [Pseudonocardia abyssalis]MBW0136848.1 hypothetical protein [Pseudonocardia abyssalis]